MKYSYREHILRGLRFSQILAHKKEHTTSADVHFDSGTARNPNNDDEIAAIKYNKEKKKEGKNWKIIYGS